MALVDDLGFAVAFDFDDFDFAGLAFAVDFAFDDLAFFALRPEEDARRWAAGMSARTTAFVSCLI